MLTYKSDRLIGLDDEADTFEYEVIAIIWIPEPNVSELDLALDVGRREEIGVGTAFLENSWILQINVVKDFEHSIGCL